MRTALFLIAGLLLMTVALILGRLFSPEFPGARSSAVLAALGLWLVLTGFNLWVGVAKAGYSVREEVPVFLLLFAVPAVAALVARRWLA